MSRQAKINAQRLIFCLNNDNDDEYIETQGHIDVVTSTMNNEEIIYDDPPLNNNIDSGENDDILEEDEVNPIIE